MDRDHDMHPLPHLFGLRIGAVLSGVATGLFIIALVNCLLVVFVKPTFVSPETKEVMTWQPYIVLNAVGISIWLMVNGFPSELVLMTTSAVFCLLRIINTAELLDGLSNS